MTTNETKVAVIGTGSIGYRHLQVLRFIGISSIAISMRAARRVELEAEGWSCATSLCEAADKGVSAAVIATDTRCHVETPK
jgi:threonine dehydrogenase-like Zn-dependent dehydrogenase